MDGKEAVKAELKRRLKKVEADLEDTDRRDPFRNELYDYRRQLRQKLADLEKGVTWESEYDILSRHMPEEYGDW